MNRIGIGYDVHRLVEGRKLIIGGVDIPYEKGLLGHSDADVLAHAVMDALLGALGKGDVGELFPPSDGKWKDADSMKLLAKVAFTMQQDGYFLENLDAIVVAERPKMATYRGHMRENLARVLHSQVSRVNVKFTTTEGTGPEGEGKTISAKAALLLTKTSPTRMA